MTAPAFSRGKLPIRDEQPQMSGGLNTVSSESTLLPTQVRRSENARLTEYGAMVKRGGTQRITSALAANIDNVLNATFWTLDDGTKYLVGVGSGGGSNRWFRIAVTGSLPYTITQGNPAFASATDVSFAVFREGGGNTDYLYIADGGPLNRFDGAVLTENISGTASVTDIAVHNQRLWGCGDDDAPQTVYYSALNDGDSLGVGADDGGAIIVRTFGDETIQTIASVGTSLLIFHRRGISRITGYGESDIVADPAGLTPDVGVIAKNSVVTVDNVAYFVTDRGLYRCTEAEVQPVASPVQPDPTLPIIRSLEAADFTNIRTGFNRATREVWVSLPSLGVYIYHTILQAWAGPFTGGYIGTVTKALVDGLDANGLPVMYRCDDDGWTLLCDAPGIFTDDAAAAGTGGTAVAMSVQFRRFYAGTQTLAKQFRFGYLTATLNGSGQTSVKSRVGASSRIISLPPSTDAAWGTGTWGEGTWGSVGEQSYRVPIDGTGYFTDVTVIDSGTTGLPALSSFAVDGYLMGRR